MTNHRYGKIRSEDVFLLEFVLKVMRKRGLHGTSLWNRNYKDIDLLVIGKNEDFAKAIKVLEKNGSILDYKGDSTIGHDYNLRLKDARFHISNVILL